jgi:hypothetical protein
MCESESALQQVDDTCVSNIWQVISNKVMLRSARPHC